MSNEQIAKDKVVTVEFELRDEHGELLDSSTQVGAPLSYLHGASEIVPGLEDALEGRACGESFEVTVSPEDGFGEKEDADLIGIPIAEFGDDAEVDEGMPLMFESEDGYSVTAWVDHIEDGTVWVDLNHPLAGMTLVFSVKIIDVRDATAEELEHGHAHGPDDEECDHC